MATFQKLDSAAILTADSKPVDSWLLKTEHENIRAAFDARDRRFSTAFPVDRRQTFSAAAPMALPLCVWPVGERLSSLLVTVRGLCSASVSSAAAMRMRLVLQETSGRIHDTEADVELSESGSVQSQDLTIDCRSVQGEVVLVWLVVNSLDIATVSSGAVVNFSGNGHSVDIGSTLQALTVAARHYRLDWSENPSGSNPDEGGGFPGQVQLIYNSTSSTWIVFPQASEYLRIAYSNWFCSLIEIGRFRLDSWSIEESSESLTDYRSALNSAKIPRALTLRNQYQRGFKLAQNRTCVVQAAGSPDTSTTTTRHRPIWPVLTYKEQTAQIMGAALANALPQYKINSDATVYRRRYRAFVLLIGLNNTFLTGTFSATLEFKIQGSSPLGWTTDVITPTLTGQETIQIDPMDAYQQRESEGESGDIIWLKSPHNLQGFWSFSDVRRSTTGLYLAECSFQESTTSQAQTDRMVTLGIKCDDLADRPDLSSGTTIGGIKIGVPSWTLIHDKGF